MRPHGEDTRIYVEARLDVFLGKDRSTCSHPTNERQAGLLARCLGELNAARCAGPQQNDTLASQRPQVVFGRIGGFEAQVGRDLLPGGWHAGFGESVLDELQHLLLAGGEFRLGHDLLHVYTVFNHSNWGYIQMQACRQAIFQSHDQCV